jgi:hypothetical protein
MPGGVFDDGRCLGHKISPGHPVVEGVRFRVPEGLCYVKQNIIKRVAASVKVNFETGS